MGRVMAVEFIWFVVFKELLEMLFNPELVQQDDTEGELLSDEKGRLQLGGLGSTGNAKGKYEGFGSSPLDREGNIFCIYSETCIRRNRMGPKIFSTLDKFPHYTK
jgi:hypothetical protein